MNQEMGGRGHYFTERNGTLGNQSSLCLISMSRISRARAHRAQHVGTLVARLLSRKNWMRKHEGGSSRQANFGRNTNSHVSAAWVPACRVCWAISSDMELLEIRRCS